MFWSRTRMMSALPTADELLPRRRGTVMVFNIVTDTLRLWCEARTRSGICFLSRRAGFSIRTVLRRTTWRAMGESSASTPQRIFPGSFISLTKIQSASREALFPPQKNCCETSSLIGTVWRTVGNALCAVPPKRKKRGANAPRPQKRAFSIENVAFRLTISRFRVISNKVLSSVPFLCLSEKPSTAIVCMRGRR